MTRWTQKWWKSRMESLQYTSVLGSAKCWRLARDSGGMTEENDMRNSRFFTCSCFFVSLLTDDNFKHFTLPPPSSRTLSLFQYFAWSLLRLQANSELRLDWWNWLMTQPNHQLRLWAQSKLSPSWVLMLSYYSVSCIYTPLTCPWHVFVDCHMIFPQYTCDHIFPYIGQYSHALASMTCHMWHTPKRCIEVVQSQMYQNNNAKHNQTWDICKILFGCFVKKNQKIQKIPKKSQKSKRVTWPHLCNSDNAKQCQKWDIYKRIFWIEAFCVTNTVQTLYAYLMHQSGTIVFFQHTY